MSRGETAFDVNVEYDLAGPYIKIPVDGTTPEPIHARNHRACDRCSTMLQNYTRNYHPDPAAYKGLGKSRCPETARPAKNHFINGMLSVIYRSRSIWHRWSSSTYNCGDNVYVIPCRYGIMALHEFDEFLVQWVKNISTHSLLFKNIFTYYGLYIFNISLHHFNM